jgi:P27 family predicted phage terminase small subunit
MRNNPGRRPLNKDEPESGALAVSVPPELTKPVEIEEWNRTIVPAIESGQIRAADRVSAIGHCLLWAEFLALRAEAAKHPYIVAVGPNKHPIPNPAGGMANKTWALLSKNQAELGFTPSSRSRVTVGKGGKKMSAVEKFQAEKRRRA